MLLASYTPQLLTASKLQTEKKELNKEMKDAVMWAHWGLVRINASTLYINDIGLYQRNVMRTSEEQTFSSYLLVAIAKNPHYDVKAVRNTTEKKVPWNQKNQKTKQICSV